MPSVQLPIGRYQQRVSSFEEASPLEATVPRNPSAHLSATLSSTAKSTATASPYSGAVSPNMPATQILRLSTEPTPHSTQTLTPSNMSVTSGPTSPLHSSRSRLSASPTSYVQQQSTPVPVHVQQATVVQQSPMPPLYERRSFGRVSQVVQGSPVHLQPAEVHLQSAEIRREFIDISIEDLKEFENRILSLLEQLALQTEAKLREQQGKILQLEGTEAKLREQQGKIMQLEERVTMTAHTPQPADSQLKEEMFAREMNRLSTSVEERVALISEEIAEERRQRQTGLNACYQLQSGLDQRMGSIEKSDSVALVQQIQHTQGLDAREAQFQEILNREMHKLNIMIEARFARMAEEMPARGRDYMDHKAVREFVKKETAELDKQFGKRHQELSTKHGENFDELSVKYNAIVNQHSELSERLARTDDTIVNKWPELNEKLARAETTFNRGLGGRSDADIEYLKTVLTQYIQEQLAPTQGQQAEAFAELQGLQANTLAELQGQQAQTMADWKMLAEEEVKAELIKMQVDLKSLVAAEVKRIGNADLEAEIVARTKNVAALHAKIGQEVAEMRKTIQVYRGDFGSQSPSGAPGPADGVMTPRMEANLDQFVRALVGRDIQRERETRFTQVSELRSEVQQLRERVR